MPHSLISLITAAAVFMHSLIGCGMHCMCAWGECACACEDCLSSPPEFEPATPWLNGDFAGFQHCACCAKPPAQCSDHAPAPRQHSHEHHKCACVFAAEPAATNSRDQVTEASDLTPLASVSCACETLQVEPFFRLAAGESPSPYGSLRLHLALGVLLR